MVSADEVLKDHDHELRNKVSDDEAHEHGSWSDLREQLLELVTLQRVQIKVGNHWHLILEHLLVREHPHSLQGVQDRGQR